MPPLSLRETERSQGSLVSLVVNEMKAFKQTFEVRLIVSLIVSYGGGLSCAHSALTYPLPDYAYLRCCAIRR